MTSNGTRERVVSGLAERGYTLGEILSTNLGASGSAVFRGEYEGKPVALKLASYGFLNSFAGENVEKLENFRRREVETLRLAGNHPSIPNYIESFDIDIENQDPVYVLAMEYLDCPSIADRIARGERISDEEAKIFFRDGLSAEDHLHTGLPTQTLHRDVKTKNALFDGSKAYLIDFDIVKQGDGSSTRATQIEPNGYYPADFYGGTDDSHRPEHDVVALGNVAIAGIAGKEIGLIRYGQGGYGLEPVDTSNLNVSPEVRKYLAKMTAPPNQRFQTAREALEGLERILGSSVQIVKPEPETQEQPPTEVAEPEVKEGWVIERQDTGNLLAVRKGGVYTGLAIPIAEEGKDVYEKVKDHEENAREIFSHTDIDSKMIDEEVRGATRAYFQYLAQENPDNSALGELARGEQSLEGIVRGVRKIKDKDQRNERADEIAEIFSGANYYGLEDFRYCPSDKVYNSRFSYLVSPIFSPSQLYMRKISIPKRAREVDSWFPKQESPKKLEDIAAVAGGVAVAGAGAAGAAGAGGATVAVAVAAGAGVAGAAGGAAVAGVVAAVAPGVVAVVVAEAIGLPKKEQNYHIRRGFIYGGLGAAANVLQALFLPIPLEQKIILGAGVQSLLTLIEPSRIIGGYYLSRRRALRQERLAAGLEGKVEKPEMQDHDIIRKMVVEESDFP
ncbi:MAG TPA: hypothetical protein ENH99_01945 [Candidatus Pacearchaeota archaeon]|nr:hypothetical protein [Candidatus Pacearchaeota archaeon]